MLYSIYLLKTSYTKLANKLTTTIAIIALIAAIGSMSMVIMNRNAFARSSDRHDHMDNKGNDRRECIYQRHVSVDQRHVCTVPEHESGNAEQEEIILSSPGLTEQQVYLNHVR
jgi:hypothetical protein